MPALKSSRKDYKKVVSQEAKQRKQKKLQELTEEEELLELIYTVQFISDTILKARLEQKALARKIFLS